MKRVGRAVEFLAWALFFAGAALVLALRFWLLPDIERFRDPIVAAASRAVGQPVRVGAMDAGWFGLYPRLNLSDVRIYDREGREALVLPRVENILSWRALARGEVRLHSMVVDGLRLQVRRDAEGALYAAGMKLGEGSGGFTDWALAQEEIILRNAEIEWHDEQRGAPPLALSALQLRLRNAGEEHALGLTARPPAVLGSTVELRALLRGRSLAGRADWSGRLYAELGYTDLAAWRAWLDYPWNVSQGAGAVRMWLTVQSGELKQATADLALTQVRAVLGEGLTPLDLASVQGRLQARDLEPGFELAGRALALEMKNGPSIAPMDFQAHWIRAKGGALAAAAVDLEPLALLAASLPFPAEARRLLAQVAPRGRLTDAKVQWQGGVETPARLEASGSFAELAAAPSGDIPGFEGLSGSFQATEAGGRLLLNSWNSAVSLPRVFPEPRIALDALNGQVEWERQGEQSVTVRLRSITFANAHLSGNAYGSYSYDGNGPGSVDLWGQFNRADGRHTARYLPHARLMGGQATRDWLVESIVGGQSSDVRFRLRGDLRDFPFTDPRRGEFSVLAYIENGVLEVAAGWPRIQDIRGELLFERERMQIIGRSGSVHGVPLVDVRVSIPRLDDASPELSISGQAEGPTASFLDYIESSPVRSMVGGLTDGLRASGGGRLRLKLLLPLKDPAKTQVAGEYEMLDNSLAVHAELPTIEHAVGRVVFSESAVTFQNVRGRMLGGELSLDGGTRQDGSLEIIAKGEATVEGARPFFDHPLARQVSGATSYVATVKVAKGRTRFLLESSLRGVASALPAPLAKAAAEDLELRMEVAPLEDGARDRVSLALGRVARAELLRERQGDDMRLQRAAVSLTPVGTQPVRLPQEPGILIYGSLPSLDVDKWVVSLPQGELDSRVVSVDVKVGQLDVYGKRIHEVTLRAGARASVWAGYVSARELAGELSYRAAEGGRLVARLTHFSLPDDYPDAAPRELAPKDLPSLDLTAERFDWRGKQLGRVELSAHRMGDDWRIDKLAMTNAEAVLTASGLWRDGAPPLAALEFDLQTNDSGAFLDRIGYPGLVKGASAQLKGRLSWVGPPTTIDYPSLAGQVELHAEGGRFLEIEPGIGKLVSLMSLQSLPRRIALDFRDVFSKGFEFEDLLASGQLASGVMSVKDFRMRGSSAQVAMIGQVDLPRETQDLHVRVIPSLGDTASTVIGLVFNPLLAIPAAIAQKILKDPLGHIFAFDYAVSGSWSDPKVAKLGVETQHVDPQ